MVPRPTHRPLYLAIICTVAVVATFASAQNRRGVYVVREKEGEFGEQKIVYLENRNTAPAAVTYELETLFRAKDSEKKTYSITIPAGAKQQIASWQTGRNSDNAVIGVNVSFTSVEVRLD
jgi:hypothetical protein